MINRRCEYFDDVADYILACKKTGEIINDYNYCDNCELCDIKNEKVFKLVNSEIVAGNWLKKEDILKSILKGSINDFCEAFYKQNLNKLDEKDHYKIYIEIRIDE